MDQRNVAQGLNQPGDLDDHSLHWGGHHPNPCQSLPALPWEQRNPLPTPNLVVGLTETQAQGALVWS